MPEEQPSLVCVCCNSDVDEDEQVHNNDGEVYCQDCFDEAYGICVECGDVTPQDDLTDAPDNEQYCESCFDNSFTICDVCRAATSNDDIVSIEYDGYSVCYDCFSEYYGTCDGCDEIFPRDFLMWSDRSECDFCESCYVSDRHDDGGDMIHSWNFTPRFRIFGKCGKHTPTYGTEVEVSTEGREKSPAVDMFRDSDLFYLTEDSSINYGFEVVSHPFTLEWAKTHEEELQPLFNLKGLARGFSAKDCGMHIHVGRQAFVGNAHLYKFTKLFMSNYDFVLKVSRRNTTRLGQWADADPWGIATNCKLKYGGQRYRAVNLQNRNTVEVRIFQSTISRQGYFANLECVDGVLNFTRDCSMRECTLPKFIEYMNDRVKQYPNFKSLFKF